MNHQENNRLDYMATELDALKKDMAEVKSMVTDMYHILSGNPIDKDSSGMIGDLRSMKKGDLAFFYHSNEGLEIVGIAKVVKESYQDPTTDETAWLVVDFKPHKKLKNTVTLSDIKATPSLSNMALIRLGRLSVQPVLEEEWEIIMAMAEKK